MLDDSGCDTRSVPRLPRQARVVLLLIAGLITATGWLVFAIAWEITWNDELALGGLVACLSGMAIIGMLSIFSRAEGEPHPPRGERATAERSVTRTAFDAWERAVRYLPGFLRRPRCSVPRGPHLREPHSCNGHRTQLHQFGEASGLQDELADVDGPAAS